MILNRFYINVIVRVTFIVVSGIMLGIVLQYLDKGYYFTLTGVIFLIILQSILLLQKVNKTNTDLEKFLSSVRDHDTSIHFDESPGSKSFVKLFQKMNDVSKIIQNVKIENERTRHLLQSVIDHADIGLLSFDMNDRIVLCNKAALKYINVRKAGKLSAVRTQDDNIYTVLKTIKPGQEILHKMKVNNILQNVQIKASELKFESSILKLVSFNDITGELDKKELDSWQKLIRVLTHEIMNSVSPVTSLASVISGYFKNINDNSPVLSEKINHHIIEKTLSGLNTIEETGKGLLDFVENYRNLTLLPEPVFIRFTVESLFAKCRLLMESNIPGTITITTDVLPADITIKADYAQVEQIMINLIKNAVEALENRKDGIIYLKALGNGRNVFIKVEDNGPGIPDDIIGDIFVPFYTTRDNGSGIGLSLSKQIMQNHNGTISVQSVPDKGTVFTLKFRL